MNINQAINLCGYDENIKKDFVSFLQKNFSKKKTNNKKNESRIPN